MSDAATNEDSTDAEVLAFERPAATTVRVERGVDPFTQMTEHERGLLLVRILCELVAYDADATTHARAS